MAPSEKPGVASQDTANTPSSIQFKPVFDDLDRW
jgi:hypothetical protein